MRARKWKERITALLAGGVLLAAPILALLYLSPVAFGSVLADWKTPAGLHSQTDGAEGLLCFASTAPGEESLAVEEQGERNDWTDTNSRHDRDGGHRWNGWNRWNGWDHHGASERGRRDGRDGRGGEGWHDSYGWHHSHGWHGRHRFDGREEFTREFRGREEFRREVQRIVVVIIIIQRVASFAEPMTRDFSPHRR